MRKLDDELYNTFGFSLADIKYVIESNKKLSKDLFNLKIELGTKNAIISDLKAKIIKIDTKCSEISKKYDGIETSLSQLEEIGKAMQYTSERTQGELYNEMFFPQEGGDN